MRQSKKVKMLTLISMITVVCVAMFSVTYAWFTESDRASMDGLELTTGSTGELKVEIAVEGGNGRMEMVNVDDSSAVIDMGLQKLANIENNKIGPGAFGEVHFYITSDVTSFNGYTISVTPNHKVVGGKSSEVMKLAKEVILYWYWPYEYGDVPDKTTISAKNTREYDLQDTMIGNYIESIGFTFEVEGNMNEN